MNFFYRVYLWLSATLRRFGGNDVAPDSDSHQASAEAMYLLNDDDDAREFLTGFDSPSILPWVPTQYDAPAYTVPSPTTPAGASCAQHSTHRALASSEQLSFESLSIPVAVASLASDSDNDESPVFVSRGPSSSARRSTVAESGDIIIGRAEGKPARPIAANPKPRPRPPL